MKGNHGLSDTTVDRISGVFERFPEIHEVMLFGSRAEGTHKPGSDIDLSLVGESLDWRLVGRIHDALEDLLLPYRFSLVVLDSDTDPDIAAHIRRVGFRLFERVPETAGSVA